MGWARLTYYIPNSLNREKTLFIYSISHTPSYFKAIRSFFHGKNGQLILTNTDMFLVD